MPLNYQIEGQGPPIVLFHGWGVTFPIWQHLAPLLKPYYTLIMPELPGNGQSPMPPPGVDYYQACAAAVEELRCQLGIDEWMVLGYSIGAWGAWRYLQDYAAHVSRVVFLCPAVLKAPSAFGLNMAARLDNALPAAGDWLLGGWRLHGLVTALGFNGRPHPYALLWSSHIASQPLPVTKACLYDLLKTFGLPMGLQGKQAVFIWARHDILAIAPRRPGKHDHIIPGNHSAPMLQAADVAQIIRAFGGADPAG